MNGCRTRIAVAAAVTWVLVTALGDLVGQVSRTQNGHVLDANLRVGSGGVNTPVRSGVGLNSQLYVTGQVTGLGRFRGRVGYRSANSLRLRLPSDTLTRFRQESVGLRGAVGGGSFRASPYYSRTSTVVGAGQIAAGRTWPGSSVPRAPAAAARRGGDDRRLGRGPLSVTRGPRGATRGGPGLVGAQRGGPAGLRPGLARPGAANVFDLLARPDAAAADEKPSPPAGTDDASTRSPLAPAPRNPLAPQSTAPLDPARPSVAQPRLRLSKTPPPPTPLRPSKTPPPPTRNPARLPTVAAIPNQDVFTDMVAALNRRQEQLKPKRPSARRLGPTARRAIPVARMAWPKSTVGPVVEAPDASAKPGGYRLIYPDHEKDKAPPGVKVPGPGGPAAARRRSPKPTPPQADDGHYVRLDARREVVLHALAGDGPDRFNRTMASAAAKLRARRYYDAAAEYAFAASLQPTNPLARLGGAVSLFCAGEPISAARHLRGAMLRYAAIMEVRLRLPHLVDAAAMKRQLAILDARLTTTDPDPLLLFIAAYMHHGAGDTAAAKAYAKRLRSRAARDPLLRAFAESLLDAAAG